MLKFILPAEMRLAGLDRSEIVTSLVFDGLGVACPHPDSNPGRV
jgi:hypothetical protein